MARIVLPKTTIKSSMQRLDIDPNTYQSSYREKLIEHLFVGELLRFAWLEKQAELEVARPEVDRSGYDVILEAGGIVRHVQLKSSSASAATAQQNVHLNWAKNQAVASSGLNSVQRLLS